jgi:Asp-tRNA(Asn)/Glu-tRNA(Gln) amidotransferase A subunit family amidase
VPFGADAQNLPIGLQLQAAQWDDARLLRAAAALEQLAAR